MAIMAGIDYSDRDLQAELQNLRRELLSILLPITLALAWLWVPYSIWAQDSVDIDIVPTLVIVVAAFFALRWKEHSYYRACWLLFASVLLAQVAAILHDPTIVPAIPNVLMIIAASALLGSLPALLLTVLTWSIGLMIPHWMGMSTSAMASSSNTLFLYLGTLGMTWLTTRPLRTSIEWAIAGDIHARNALADARERRGELYRVVRALEEATARIERMNSELSVARSEAEAARMLKARFVATVSHELRGPLNLILGFSKLMVFSPERYGEPLPDVYRADAVTIFRNTQHLATLIDDILDLSQVEAEKLPLIKEQLDVREVIREAASIVQPLIERKGLFLHQEMAEGLLPIWGDQVRLRQVLLNLLTNAVRFTDQGGVTIRAVCRETDLLISVQDTGRGIAPEEMPKLFREFHQLHLVERREVGGSGLGLSISKYLVELHGGKIWAESQQGVGTIFHFTIPLPGMNLDASRIVKTGPSHAPETQEVCLIVHQDPSIIRLLTRYITGYRVVGVPEVQHALELVQELHPRAVVTTPSLAEAMRAGLADQPFDVPIIHCALPYLSKPGQLQGILGYLIKPIKPELLAPFIHRVEREGETTVLLVDDDPDAVRLLESMLLAIPRPYRLLKAHDGNQALALMDEMVPDVVFLDLVMPGMSGEQVLDRMQADGRLRSVPVVIVSARDWVEDSLTLEMPLSVTRQKPVPISQVARCLQALLDHISPDYLPEVTVPELS